MTRISICVLFVLFGNLNSLSALTLEDVSKIIDLPKEELKFKDFSSRKRSNPNIIWAVEVSGQRPRTIYPFSISVYAHKTRINKVMLNEFREFIATKPSGVASNVREIVLENGFGVVGVPAYGPDVVMYSALISLNDQKVDLELVVGMASEGKPVKKEGWNDDYVDKIATGQGVAELLEVFCRKIEEYDSNNLKTFNGEILDQLKESNTGQKNEDIESSALPKEYRKIERGPIKKDGSTRFLIICFALSVLASVTILILRFAKRR